MEPRKCEGFISWFSDVFYCYSSLPGNYYFNSGDEKYYPCYYSCKTCSGTSRNCINCIDGYYKIAGNGNDNLCYNGNIEGYYLDKPSNLLRKCHSNCSRCTSSENSNCISCKSGFYLTEDTLSCYESKDNYYIDNNMLRKCHPNCLTCSSDPTENDMNCIICKSGYYKKEDDTKSCFKGKIDNYYLDGNIYRKCGNNCLECSSNSICITCKSNYYLKEDDHSCYDKVIENYYYDTNSKTLKKCHSKCSSCYSSALSEDYMNCITCNSGYLTEDTKSCYITKDNYYLDSNTNILRRCHKNCKRCDFPPINDAFMNCKECPINYYLTEDTDSCYDEVIDNYYLDNTGTNGILRRCHSNCLKCTTSAIDETHMNCIICRNNYYITEDTNSCYDKIIDNYYFDFDNRILKRCHPNCLRCSGPYINDTYMNCISCKPGFYITEDTNSCYNYILNNYYLDNSDNTLRRCHQNCNLCSGAPENYYSQNCITCKEGYYMTDDTNSCYRNAIKNYYFDTDMFKRCDKNCLFCYTITNKETFKNCLKCYDYYLTEDKNTCYNYIINNIYNLNNNLNDINQENLYFEFPMDNHLIQFASSKYLKNNINLNITSINLEKCEDLLKNANNIPSNDALYYEIINVKQEGMKIPKIIYDIYYLRDNNFIKLDLSVCKGEKIEVSYPIKINENIEIYDSSSKYYNDICYILTSKYNTDIHLNDRREEFIKNNLTICDENCTLINYINDIAKCSCDIKYNFPLIQDIKFDNNLLKNNFIDINEFSNLKVMYCYKIVFKKNNILSNYGLFIMTFIFLFFFISIFLFSFKFYRLFLKKINERIFPSYINKNFKVNNSNKNKNKINKVKFNKKVSIKKNNSFKKKDIKIYSETRTQKTKDILINLEKKTINKKSKNISPSTNKMEVSDNSRNPIKRLNPNKKNSEVINLNDKNKNNNYNNFELNSLSYDKALISDKRTFRQYYYALLTYNNPFLFSFIRNGDYNPRLIKIFFYFFLLSLNFVINALFFNDEEIQMIYKDKGKFNYVQQLPKIIYSTILSVFIIYLMKYFFLSEKVIEEIKEDIKKNNTNMQEKINKLNKKLKIKFTIFFIIVFILLLLFSFYISCFCGVYKNTQIHLIIDASITFFICNVYSFITCILPAVMRITALKDIKKNKVYLYNISQIVENI